MMSLRLQDAKWTEGCTGLIKELWHTNNPTTRQEALKALGEVDVKGWGIK